MRSRVDDCDRQARTASQELDKVALGFVTQRSERDLFREKSRKTAVVGIEVETLPCDGVLFEPAADCAQGRAFAHVPPGLHGNDKTMMDGFHGIWLQGDAPRFPSGRCQLAIRKCSRCFFRAVISEIKSTMGCISESANSHVAGDHSRQTSG